jgi:C1A family cysteine protease
MAMGASAELYSENKSDMISHWEQFKVKFARKYSSKEEEDHRFGHFIKNLRLADQRNAAKDGSHHGVTKFADMSEAEFKNLLGYKKPKGVESKAEKAQVYKNPRNSGLVDWTGVYTTPVKNQGQCGSCWAFSATEQIESDTMRTLGTTYELSPQQVVNCDRTAFGCGGGWTEHAYNYVSRAGGIEQESDYPYYSGMHPKEDTDCDSDKSKFVATVNKYYTVESESDMADYMKSTGPLSVCVDANSWNTYTGGVMSKCGNSVDHCVQATGVDTDGSEPYWKVRNSWGTDWGEDGFIRLSYGSDTCAISSDPTYVAVSLV